MSATELMFKPKQRSAYARAKRVDPLPVSLDLAPDNDDTNAASQLALAETKEAQRFRKRAPGVSAAGLATGAKISAMQELTMGSTWSQQTGGILPTTMVRDRQRDRDGEDDNRAKKGLNSTFSAGTGVRNEDADMLKYIEDKMQLKLDGVTPAVVREKSQFERMQEDLYHIPQHLAKMAARPEAPPVAKTGMLSNAVLSGIPEVNLGYETKIRNIEETEQARLRVSQGDRPAPSSLHNLVPKPVVSSREDYSAGRFMHGSRLYQEKLAQAVAVPVHELAFERAKHSAFERGVAPVAQFKHLEPEDLAPGGQRGNDNSGPHHHGGHGPGGKRDQASDDQVIDHFRKRQRKF